MEEENHEFQQEDRIVTLKGYQVEEINHALALQEILHEEEEVKETFAMFQPQSDAS